MKKFYILAGLLFLASCGQAEIQQNTTTQAPAIPETVVEQSIEVEVVNENEDELEENNEVDTPTAEINTKVDALEIATEDISKTVTLDAGYTNPRGPVDMAVTYSTNSAWVLTAINVVATSYDVSSFNDEIQSLVGSTLEDAAEYTSGSSLTGYAFNQAVKAELD